MICKVISIKISCLKTYTIDTYEKWLKAVNSTIVMDINRPEIW